MSYIRDFALQRAIAEGATHMRELPSRTLLFFRPSAFATVVVPKSIGCTTPETFRYACMRVVWSGEDRKDASYYSDWKWELVESIPSTAYPVQ